MTKDDSKEFEWKEVEEFLMKTRGIRREKKKLKELLKEFDKAYEIYRGFKGWLKTKESLRDVKLEQLLKGAELTGVFTSAGEVSTRQIRKVFDEIKRLKIELRTKGGEGVDLDRLLLLRPKLAYLEGKESRVRDYTGVMDIILEKVKNHEDLEKLADFSEAVVAYHKFYGGND